VILGNPGFFVCWILLGSSFFSTSPLSCQELNLTKKEKAEVKQVARSLLQTIKQAKLVLDWRKKLRTRAYVYSTVKKVLDELPRTYTPEVYQAKCETIYNHIFEKYQGEGVSVYSTV